MLPATVSGSFEIHSHSTISDGRLSPLDMAEKMAASGVRLWSLTDHDNVSGCEEAERGARAQGITFVSGIEISAQYKGTSIHVLGYGFDRTKKELATYGDQMVAARRNRMKEMVEKVSSLGMKVTTDEVHQLSPEGNIGRPHLATALVRRGYVESEQEAFDRWLHREGPGYVPMTLLSVRDAIALIRGAGGLVVLAHPARYGDLSELLPQWKIDGLWGLEIRHPSHSTQDEARLLRVAKKAGLQCTASNDWHGSTTSEERRLGKVRYPEAWATSLLKALSNTYEGKKS